MSEMKYVYYGEIERFGYTLQCFGRTEEEVRNALIEEYVESYKKRNNGSDPRKAYELMQEESDDYDLCDALYYETFLDELYIDRKELGHVEWS